MADWTHRICERCWFDGRPIVIGAEVIYGHGFVSNIPGIIQDGEHEGAYRQPIQLKVSEPGACCHCGGMTITQIFMREDENDLLCRGRHDDPGSWSR